MTGVLVHTCAMQYTLNPPLIESTLHSDPLAQLQAWLAAATAAGMMEPTAMTLATIGPEGRPASRVVLLKGFHDDGLCFYTNYEGRKGREIAAQPQVAATFWWDRLERQVRVEGRCEKLPRAVTQQYFESRPRESQLGALISRQSQVVVSRELLDARFAEAEQRLRGQAVPLPEHWGGYVIRPERMEFWQGRLGRLHDRLCYRREGADWIVERLEP